MKKISTTTKSYISKDNEFNLLIQFEREEEQIQNSVLLLERVAVDEVEILSEPKSKNGVSGIECELMVNQDKGVSFELDIDGSLSITDINADRYDINEMGELIMKL